MVVICAGTWYIPRVESQEVGQAYCRGTSAGADISMTPCLAPGCATLVDRGRCDQHQAARWRGEARDRLRAGDPAMTSYPRSWRRVRSQFLADNPTCLTCGTEATVADHEPPRRQLIEAGIANPDDPAWLQPLCKPCHDRKTATVDGGFGRQTVDIHQR